jgi:hypothetical protein
VLGVAVVPRVCCNCVQVASGTVLILTALKGKVCDVYVLLLSLFIVVTAINDRKTLVFSPVTYELDLSEWMIIDVLSIYVFMYNAQDTVESDKHICTTGL